MKKNISIIFALSIIISSFTSCGSNYESSYSKMNTEESSMSFEDTIAQNNEYYDDEFNYSNEEYEKVLESGFKNPETEPLSTFSVDVDTASYSNSRRFIKNNSKVPEDAVRIEEFINYFDYDYDSPKDKKLGQYIEIADCPWNNDSKLMMVGIQSKKLKQSEIPPSNLVFLIDSSGSMKSYDKLPLVQEAFTLLTENLTEYDRVSIVTYAGSSETILDGAKGNEQKKIISAINSISANGNTNGEGGINTAYSIAEDYFIEGGNNRVILATDGDLNVGASSSEELVKLIESKRDKGIFLSVLGFGTGNYKDARLEAVADNGNGTFNYIDSVDEAKRVLVDEISSTLFTIAKDVKIQVEFNPVQVENYRLIGYDNRIMNAEDFYDNTKDAGDVGESQSVTALYEIQLKQDGTYHNIPLEFATEPTTSENERTELCKLSITYKDFDTDEDIYISELLGMEKYNEEATYRLRLASAVTEFAMLLKNSEYKGSSDFSYIISTAEELAEKTENEKIIEFYELVANAKDLYT